MGVFSMLKDQGLGHKLSKFKQDRMLTYAQGRGLDPALFSAVSKGMCRSYVIGWLLEKLQKPAASPFPFERNQGASAGTTIGEKANFEWALQHREMEHGRSVAALLEKLGFSVKEASCEEFPDLLAAGQFLSTEMTSNIGYFLACTIEGSGEGHALGWFIGDGLECEFFDPNVGEYAITADALKFLETYEAIVASHYKWKYGKVLCAGPLS